jgi:SpoIID/LytB domain protein
VVLKLSMQKYLYGLGEMPASWPAAALRAQAVAGRTYALHRIRSYGQHRYPCDCALYDGSIDQVYVGDERRTGSGPWWGEWKSAVRRTRGLAVVRRGKPIQALYSSSSGGHTENNENVWGGTPLPYLRGVRDRFDGVDANPNFRWRVEMPWRKVAARLDRAFGTGRLAKISLVRPFGVSGRVTVVTAAGGGVRIAGSGGTVRVDGWALRSALDLKDTWFRIKVRGRARAPN